MAGAGQNPAGRRIDDITQAVDRDHGADQQLAQLHAMRAEAALHRMLHAKHFADGGAGAGADRPHAKIFGFRRPAGAVAHFPIRTHRRIAARQIKQHGGRDDRHPGHADIKADAAFFEILHDPAGRVQSESASARQNHGVDLLDIVLRPQQVGFPRSGRAAPHIHSRGRAFGAKDHRAPGRRCQIVGIAQPDAGKLRDLNVLHRIPPPFPKTPAAKNPESAARLRSPPLRGQNE